MKPTREQLIKCQEKSAEQDFLAKYLYRKISIRITRHLAQTPLTPSQISIVGFFLALVAAYFFSVNNYICVLAGVIFAQFSIVLDCVDGEVARLKNMESKFGAWLDGMAGKLSELALYFGIAFGCYHRSCHYFIPFLNVIDTRSSIFILLSGLIASRLLIISANETILIIHPSKEEYSRIITHPTMLNGTLKKVKAGLPSYGTLVIELLILGAFLNQFLITISLLFVINIVVLLIIVVRLLRACSK